MDSIIQPNKDFNFLNLSLEHPSSVQNNTYFTKINYDNKPLYIQTSKSLTRQGFIKSGKKYYCDLMFDNNSEEIINWFEKLEERCQKLIFEKSNSWFQNPLDLNDIETAFNSVLRIYKSGKFYLVRTNIKTNSDGNPLIKVYNENELVLSIDDIKENTKIISILEIQGIKFTSRNFQIEIELKQTMIIDDEPFFESCLIKKTKNNLNISENNLDNKKLTDTFENIKPLEKIEKDKQNDFQHFKNNFIIDNLDEKNKINNNENNEDRNKKDQGEDQGDKYENEGDKDENEGDEDENEGDENEEDEEEDEEDEEEDQENENIKISNEDIDNKKNNDITIDFEELNNDYEDLKDLKEIEVNFNEENNLETFTLKKPNQVYYELYKEARN